MAMNLDTAIRLSAQVTGGANIDRVKRSIQELAGSSKTSARDMAQLRSATFQLARANEGTIAGIRNSISAFRGLQEQARIGSREFRRYGQEIQQLEAKLKGLTGTAAQAQRQGLGRQGLGRQALGGALGAFATGGGVQGALGAAGGTLAAGAGPAGLAAAAGISAVAGISALAVRVGVDAETAQVRLKALTDQFGEYNEAQASAARIAQALRISQVEATDGFSKLYAALRPTGITLQEVEDAFVGFTAAARASGATAEESSAALQQLKQALGSGILQGDELRSIREQAPAVGQAIAKEMGVTIGELKKLGEQGKITTEVVLRALARLRGEKLGQLQQQFNTSAQAMKDLQVATQEFGRIIAQTFGPTAVALVKGLTAAVRELNAATTAFKSPTAATAEQVLRSGVRPKTAMAESVFLQGAGELFKGTSGAGGVGITGLRKEAETIAKLRRQSVNDVLFQLMQDRMSRVEEQRDIGTGSQQQERAAAAAERLAAQRRAAAATTTGAKAAGTGSTAQQFQPSSRARALLAAANKLGVSPLDLATIISFETGGTFNPSKWGGAGGNYMGLIQFGANERKAYGARQGQSFEEQVTGPVVRYFQDRFEKAGMATQGASLLDLYTTVLAGNPRANRNARDSFGTSPVSGVQQMGPHRQKALQTFFGGSMANVGFGAMEQAEAANDAFEAQRRAAEAMRQQLATADQLNIQLKDQLALTQETDAVKRRALEGDIKLNDIAREYGELRSNVKSADELTLINANEVIAKRIVQLETERDLNELYAERARLMQEISQAAAMPTVFNELEQQQAALDGVLQKYPLIGSAADAAANLATQGMASIVSGAESAEEVFANFLQSVADALMDAAKQMITQYIAIGIARMFAGFGAPSSAAGFSDFGGGVNVLGTAGAGFTDFGAFNFDPGAMLGFANGGAFTNGIVPFARGGIVTSPTLFQFANGGALNTGVMGEAGPEAILPLKRDSSGRLGVSAEGTGGSSPVTVNVAVDATGSSVQGDPGRGQQLGRVIAAAVQAELVKQKRPGGILA